MTLKEYLEKQMNHFIKAAQEVNIHCDPEYYYLFKGRYDAYADILLSCPDSVLSKKILDEVW